MTKQIIIREEGSMNSRTFDIETGESLDLFTAWLMSLLTKEDVEWEERDWGKEQRKK